MVPRHYVLAAGAINSPALLLRSGAPDPHQQLGRRTFLHPVVLTTAVMPEPVQAWAELEDGTRRDRVQLDHWVDPVQVDGALVGEASFEVPGDLPLGYHRIRAQSSSAAAHCPLIMTPRALDPSAIVGERQWGFMEQAYATRSRASWGLGDLHDCATLAQWSGRELGAGFLLLNPLHAAEPNAPMTPSPYLPVTRRFANPIYLRVEDIPDYLRPHLQDWIDDARRANDQPASDATSRTDHYWDDQLHKSS